MFGDGRATGNLIETETPPDSLPRSWLCLITHIRQAIQLTKHPLRPKPTVAYGFCYWAIGGLVNSRCGPMRIICINDGGSSKDENYAHVTVNLCEGFREKVIEILERCDEVKEDNQDEYPCLWEMKLGSHDAELNSLLQMPASAQKLMEASKNTQGETGTPFERLPTEASQWRTNYLRAYAFVLGAGRRPICLRTICSSTR